ncbi:MAG: hypothetical protein ACYCUI_09605 [Vulcanimicrobiaceae bacterium]
MPWYDRAMVGAGSQFVSMGQGAEQLGAQVGHALGIVPQSTVNAIQTAVNNNAPFQAAATRGAWGHIGAALPYVLPAAAGPLAGALGVTADAPAVSLGAVGDMIGAHPYAAAAAANAAIGGLQAVPSGGNRLANTGIGAATGALGEGLGAALGKTTNAIAGNFAPRIAEAIAAARDAKVPLSVGDLGNAPSRWAEALATKVPGSGQVSAFARQADAVHAMASDIPAQVAPNVAARVADGENPGDILAQAVRDNYHATLAQSRAHYDALDHAIADNGVAPVAPTEAQGAVKQAVSEFPGIFSQGGADLPKSTQTTLEAIHNGEPVSFADLHQARSAVLSAKRNIAPGQNRYRASLLSKVAAGIDSDMNAWTGEAANHAPVWDAYRNAQDYYTNNVVPFSDKGVAPLLANDFNAERLGNKISPQAYSTVQKLADAGGADGQEALRYMMATRPTNAATIGEGFSVPRYANDAGKTFNGPAAPRVFDEATLARLRSQAEVARMAKRAGISANDVHTGAQAIPLLEGLGAHAATGSVPGAAATMAGIGLGTRAGMGILRSKPAINFYAADRSMNPALLRLLRGGTAAGSAQLTQYLNGLLPPSR